MHFYRHLKFKTRVLCRTVGQIKAVRWPVVQMLFKVWYLPSRVVVMDVFLQLMAIPIIQVETPNLMGLVACMCAMKSRPVPFSGHSS